MEAALPRVKQNYIANIVAAVAAFLIEAGWYSYFQREWLQGLGRTRAWLSGAGVNPALQYGAALLAAFFMATAISCVVQIGGRQTIFRGIGAGILLWLGFVVPAFATEYVFEVRTWQFFGITIGVWLASMIVMGAIVGVWRRSRLV